MSRGATVVALAALLAAGLFAVWFAWGRSEADPTTAVFGANDLVVEPPAAAAADSGGSRDGLVRSEVEMPAAGAADGPALGPGPRGGELRIRGRILGSQGQPLPGASVRVTLRAAQADGAARLLRVRTPVTTAADGRFQLVGTGDRVLAVTVDVRAPSHAPASVASQLGAAAAGQVDLGDLRLLAGGEIAGQVVDVRASGVAGASVSLQPSSSHALSHASDLAAVLPPALTDPSGGYRFRNLAPGSYRVRASAPGTQRGTSPSVTVADGRESLVEPIRLEAGVELAGKVLGSAGAPVRGASVRARGDRVTTGEDGTFRVPHLAPGPLAVEVRADGFLGWKQPDVDPSRELIVRLEQGLAITGVVTDAGSGAAVTSFAVKARRLRAPGSSGPGEVTEQLQKQAAALRARAARAENAQAGAADTAVAAELEARARALPRETQETHRVPGDLGPAVAWPGGRFSVDGLDEGTYVVDVLAPEHRFVRTGPLELKRGGPSPHLEIAVAPAISVRGVVASRGDGAPIAGAWVEIARVRDPEPAAPAAGAASPFAWTRLGQVPPSDIVGAVRSDERGRFDLRHVAPGRYLVSARHARYVAAASPVLEVTDRPAEVRLELPAMASLRGRLLGVPAGKEALARVLAVGGAATMRTVAMAGDGTYRIESLEPGEYLLQAFLGDAPQASEEQVRVFLTGKPKAPRTSVTLGEGEVRELDLRLEVPPAGSVRGTVTINGAPSQACRVELHPPDDARPITAVPAAGGEFTFAEVPAGAYELRVTVAAGNRQELHREPITVVANECTRVQPNLSSGGLRGKVVARDGVPEAQLEGTLYVLPGATAQPADLAQYARDHRVHEVRVRGGAFSADALTAGPAHAVLQIRGRQPADAAVTIQPGTTTEVQIAAGVVR